MFVYFIGLVAHRSQIFQVLRADLWNRLASRNPGLQYQIHKSSGKYQAEARPHRYYRCTGRSRVEAISQHSTDRQRNPGLARSVLPFPYRNPFLAWATYVPATTNGRQLGTYLEGSPADIALNTLEPHSDYVGIICTKSVSAETSVTRPSQLDAC